MKAKYLFLTLSVFCCLGMKATEIVIPLSSCSDHNDNWIKDERSITLLPTAAIDGNVIHIYTNITVSGISITVKDQVGTPFYSNLFTVSSRNYTIDLKGLVEGEYTLEIEICDNIFCGYFYFINNF